jgi:hypothetical protein
MSGNGYQTRRERRAAERRSSRAQGREPAKRRSSRGAWRGWILAGAMLLVGIGAWGAFQVLSPSQSGSSSGLPGPAGGSRVAQDINTLVGTPAPEFQLTDAEGQTHEVITSGKPIVLIFHMGIN